MLFDGILIKGFQHFKTDRSTSALFHLLSGKKSIQTVQDAHLYNLQEFYGIYKTINKQIFTNRMNYLIKNNLIVVERTSSCVPSSSGLEWLYKHEDQLSFEFFNGLKYYTIAPIFSNRILLLIQTLSNSRREHYSFIPVIDNPLIISWMKRYYQQIKNSKASFLKDIYSELFSLLSNFPDTEASFFVSRLSGYRVYGKSSSQLSEHYHMILSDVQLVWVRLIHRMLSIIYSNHIVYPLLFSLIRDLKNNFLITNSANKTYWLLQKEYSPEEIAQKRHLKVNTIYDHIVEIAMFEMHFPLTQYVSEEQHNEIIHAIKQTKTFALKEIKETVDKEISYFQIRLVLARQNSNK